jgi:hypothetical protein
MWLQRRGRGSRKQVSTKGSQEASHGVSEFSIEGVLDYWAINRGCKRMCRGFRTTIFGAQNLHNFRIHFRTCTCIYEYTHASYTYPQLYPYCTYTPHTLIVSFANKTIWFIFAMIQIERLVGGSFRCSQDNLERVKLTTWRGLYSWAGQSRRPLSRGGGNKNWSKL